MATIAPPFAAHSPFSCASLDPVAERLLGRPLQLGVDRQPHGVPGLGQLAELAVARHLAERVHAHLPDPRLPRR